MVLCDYRVLSSAVWPTPSLLMAETCVKEGGDIVEHLNELKELWERLNLFGDEDYKISNT